ncbi:hypothetical protein LBMAG15_03940 [Actinomycetes bacterium]|nr:hypothetical protein LBMAG15_03940 [Actinomycetes bacterium]
MGNRFVDAFEAMEDIGVGFIATDHGLKVEVVDHGVGDFGGWECASGVIEVVDPQAPRCLVAQELDI